MKIVLTGGGTGGHAYPALSVAEALRAAYPDCELLYLGSRDGPEARLAGSAGIPFRGLTSRKLRKALSPSTALVGFALLRGLAEARSVLNEYRPDLVIGTGGYAAAAVVAAQSLRRGKTLIHEQNAIPGRTNLLLGRFATRICVSFQDTLRYFPPGKTVVTGLPIRAGLLNLPSKEESRSALGLRPDVFTVLVLGGSQGALAINRVVAESIPALRELPVQVLHQAGERNYPEAAERCRQAGWGDYHVRPYLEDMSSAYGAADLVLGRCGASTIAEITAVGLPAVLAPYPFAYADHQRYNGELVAKAGGAVLVRESELTPDLLADTIRRLACDEQEIKKMAAASMSLGRPDAARRVAEEAAKLIQGAGDP